MKNLFRKLQLHLALLALRVRAVRLVRPPCLAQFANLGEGSHEHGRKSYLPDPATTATSRYLLWKTGATDNDHCALCGAGDTPLGPSDDQADPNNLDLPITLNLLGAIRGTVRVTSDGTLVQGSRVTTGANGLATAATTGQVSFGIALLPTDVVGATASGTVIEMIPTIPAKYTF